MGEIENIEEVTAYGDIFITYRNHRIFYKWKSRHLAWFVIVYKTGVEAAAPGYPCLGCEWLSSKTECIKWGKRLIDKQLG